ncbi:MAG: peptidoglycan DL-endopeptidase CwlO [Gaiellales bacterium]|nr:peptidoglycan DL-endopeptidase CwlO [Gaiellales bacterium]
MPTRTGLRRWLPSPASARRTGVVAVVALSALLSLAGPASADRISDTRAQIASVERQMHEFDMKLEASIEAYNNAQQQLADVRAAIRENTIKLKIAKHNLKVAQGNLANFLVSAYKRQNDESAAAYVLGSGSWGDLVDRVEYVERLGKAQNELLSQIVSAEREVAKRQTALVREEKKRVVLVAQKREQKQQVEAQLNERQRMLGNLRGDLRQLIEQRREARDRAAREAAARLAQQQADDSGSSGGSSGGGSGGGYNPPPAGTLGQQAAAIAQQYLGVPYVWGGASPSGFDCSGLVVYVFGQLGVSLPHYTGSLWNSGPHVDRSQLAAGDLVFFYGLGHMGIYIGGGLFIHAPHTGDVVKISNMNDSWYSSAYDGAVRIVG